MKLALNSITASNYCVAFSISLLLALTLVLPSRAQFTTARLNGTVTDGSGLALVGASIRVEQVGTGYAQSATTDPVGQYLFPSLPVGNYRVTATIAGFKTYIQQGIILAVGQARTVPIRMELGSVVENVTVTANASMVTTDSATLGQVIDEKAVVELPLSSRYVQQLVFLTPGAANVTANYCAANCEGGVFPSEQYAKVNGAGANGVSYQLDGADFNDTYINTNLPFPNPDAIQEFNLMTANMSAIYGDAIGGVVNVSLKSGSDTIHGGAFEFAQNSIFNSKNYFATSVSPLNQNQFGGDIGGPILKNRLFYFGSYQGTRFSATNNGLGAYVPNANERLGDFSDLLPAAGICSEALGTCVQLVDPTTGIPFVNNQIPVSPIATYILNQIPLPNAESLGIPAPPGEPNDGLYYDGLPAVQTTNEYLVKVDFIAGKHHLSGHYFQQSYSQPLVLPPSTNILKMRGDSETLRDKNVSVVDIYTISSHALLGSYYGLTIINGNTYSSAPFTMADAGVTIALPPSKGGGNVPSLNLGASTFGLGSGIYGVWNRGDQSLREVATITKGKHVLQFGGELVRVTQPMGNTFQQGGTFEFTNALTGYDMADFELGAMSSFTQGGGLYLDFTGINWSTFVQDDWKITSRFTLSAGLRWDPFIPSKDSLGRVACFEPGAAQSVRYPNAPADLIYGGSNHDKGCPAAGIFADYTNYGPRLGFTYQLDSNGKSSLRGGIGYYYEPPNSLIYQQMVGVPPFAPVINLTDISFADPYGSAGVISPFPGEFGPSNPGPSATFPSGAISFSQLQDPHLKLPMILTYNLTFEHSFWKDWLFRMAYVGNNGHRLYGTGDQESGLLQLNPAIYVPGQSTEDNTQQRRVYPGYASIASINSGVNSNFNALQVTLEKRLSKGFSLLTNFSWAKALDDYAPQGSPYYTNTCTCGRHFDYGASADDLSKVFKLSGSYETPHIHGNGFVSKLGNGWQLTAIASLQTGNPFTIFSGVDNSFSAIGADRADLTIPNIRGAVIGHVPHPGVIGQWFDPTAFTANAIGTFGNSGKNAMFGPRFFDTDLAAIKNFKFRERFIIQFRGEFFNAFNNVNFGLPGNVQNSPGFGQISGTQGSGAYGGPTSYGTSQPRTMQFGLKASF
jgi:hypothetical protein